MRDLINLVETMLDEEKAAGALRREPYGMGLEILHGQGFALAGGMRSGSSPGGMLRARYVIIDTDMMQQGVSQEDATVGFVDVYKDANDDIRALINIELNKKNRRAGMGSVVVKSLLATAPGDLMLFDIRPKAYGFWKKMGVEFYGNGAVPITSLSKHRGFVQGVIRKPGSTTPFRELLDSINGRKSTP